MSTIDDIFSNLFIVHKDCHNELASLLQTTRQDDEHSEKVIKILDRIFLQIDNLASILKADDTILISVKNQKVLRTSFQLIACFGISPCLLPGVGINLSKRFSTMNPSIKLSDEEKYKHLVLCTEFITRCYTIPVLRSIIISFHLSDYLASLIQLSFAPLKKPGTYKNFTMTQERYVQLSTDRQRFLSLYENLVTQCFQPTLMKELLVLQSVVEPPAPVFVKKVIAKEMSRRLLAPGGLLSLIRCFMESYDSDTGLEWKKIDMLCKILTSKQGSLPEEEYLKNICSQLTQILSLNNTHYLATAVASALSLNEKYSQFKPVSDMISDMFQSFSYEALVSKQRYPGTFILSPQEVENRINILEVACSNSKIDFPLEIIASNIQVLFQVGTKCTKNEAVIKKIYFIVTKYLEKCEKHQVAGVVKQMIFGDKKNTKITIEEYDAGVGIKCLENLEEYPTNEAANFFLHLFKKTEDEGFVKTILETFLNIFMDLTKTRAQRNNRDLLHIEDDAAIMDETDQHYALTLQILSEISTETKVLSAMKKDATSVLNFIEYFLVKNVDPSNDECATISLVLLNTILSDSTKEVKDRCSALIPVLRKISLEDGGLNSIISKEAIDIIKGNNKNITESACEKAITDVFDSCLPVRTHGIIELTKLLEAKDKETLSKKHFIFCLFQEQIKDPDSYIYLAAVNGLAALGIHCTEDVLSVLCKEFLNDPTERNNTKTVNDQEAAAKIRMTIGDAIVKVTKGLGEMAVVHKATLLNTMLCACRDHDPYIRTSALSNLAEIARVLNYKMGTIIYEVLLCIWSTIETDKAVECRRAAVMVIASLLKGLGTETLIQLKDNLLPIYRTLKELYRNDSEDHTVRLHAQIALEELNDIVNQFMFPEIKLEKPILL